MPDAPLIVDRVDPPYVAIRGSVTMQTIGPELRPLIPELFGRLGSHRIAPAGQLFWK